MPLLIYSFFLCFTSSLGFFARSGSQEPEIQMNVSGIILYHNYPGEEHQVTTDDGYILSMQRIPFGVKSTSTKNRPVVLLQHGLEDSSFTWVANGPEKSLGFYLADRGFDVWLCNSRGNRYSKSHTKFPRNSRDFWNFDWDDMAKYDLPAAINYVLSVTKASKLSYIGHSQGTQIAFARFSMNSDLNSKVSSFVALTPVAYLGNLKTAVKYLAAFAGGINLLSNLLTNGEFLPQNDMMKAMGSVVCGDKAMSVICGNLMFLLLGVSTDNLNFTRVPIYVAHVPAGTSSKNMVHYSQSYLSNEFQMYDYGVVGNMMRYKQFTPQKYFLNNINIPIAAFYGGQDWLAVPKDVLRTLQELGDTVKLKVYIPEYNHVDFIWGITADKKVFPQIVDFINQYNR